MNWLYLNYIINSWNYLKENWNYLDYKSKRCVYFMLFIFFSVFLAPIYTQILPKLYNLSKKKIINIVSLVEPILMNHYYPGAHLSIPNHKHRQN